METQRRRGEELLRQRLDQVEKTIRGVAKGHHLRPEDEEELRSQVLLKLAEDGESIFRKYRGEARFGTYLTVVVRRVLFDHRARERGRWRPSARARRMGPLAVALDQRIHRDGLEPAEAVEDLLKQYHPTRRQELEKLASALPYRPRSHQVSLHEKVEVLAAPESTPDRLEADERQSRHAQLQDALDRLINGLSDEDQELLRQRFGQGWTVRRIAASRAQPTRPLYRRFERILCRLRRGLEQNGVQWSLIASTLEEHRAELDLFIEGFSEAVRSTGDSASG